MGSGSNHQAGQRLHFSQDFFLARFQTQEDYFVALAEGPWFLNDRFLLVQRWKPNFRATEQTTPTKMAIWVHLPELPIEYYDLPTLHRIAAAIGTPIKVDAHTSTCSRGQFARICAEVDIEAALPPSVPLEGKTQQFKYEVKTSFCLIYGMIGHNRINCPNNTPTSTNIAGKAPSSCPTDTSWKVVETRPRRRRATENHVPSQDQTASTAKERNHLVDQAQPKSQNPQTIHQGPTSAKPS
ncbi:hypothetical protein COLO4_06049 [Corchorus olitorius]|uniref:DUF4283 domain-containing protein n=1 Tax=Corchorus olitorius TaxID=93759 RepID=A0A1R3KP71_9ROSI|nr:hypothetical protein COLO4_06049 [Corchorus olitorius]